MSNAERAQQWRDLLRLLNDSAEVIIRDWESGEQTTPVESGAPLPSPEVYEATRIVTGACGMFLDLVQEPGSRLTEIACANFISRALHVAIQARVAEILADADPTKGMSAALISEKTGINEQKLTRVLRTLCTVHVFNEVRDGYFANNRTSDALARDPYLYDWLLLHAQEVYTASDQLLPLLFDKVKTDATSNRVTAWQDAIGADSTVWEYLEQHIEQPDGSLGPRPQLGTWARGMVGGGHAFASGMYSDYPWEALGSSTIVDVGGGAGGTSLDLAGRFPNLRFVVEDLPSTIQQAQAVWTREYPEALQRGRVKLVPHNFFTEQPIKGAEVYFMRYILHDWPDDQCVTILSHLRAAMGPDSVILVADQVINTTVGSPLLKAAPPPLPPNYGVARYFGNMHDLTMMAIHNGMERTPEMLDAVAKHAGLKVTKIWECRGIIYIAELRIREDS
ncbi:S-adenosyl-L-methionine-dependent methyltransferase [Wolfiporia cocos MD-104 SS10]|uniref:S-adenosyl-L-methionine-dependent methyltransferase n=1 Tax=Wolfiporia cocos (strain MD-104) TaxID=742152 RepID=A0A2H3JGY9_WOLCO|nr:S-adenosyl-L-methionine-dependent methyltransferase [Wolfiporia cocos MD-104 SS10]